VANQKIASELDLDGFYIHPASGDAGSAIGCALNYYLQNEKNSRPRPLVSPYLGASYDREEILDVIKNNCIELYIEFDNNEELLDFVADRLMEKNVCGWFHANAEWGPRALGSRSIIASPLFDDMKAIVNAKIKFREPYRPFAPSVLAEYADEWFEVDKNKLSPMSPESYMLKVAPVKAGKGAKIPAVTHVDYSARIQTVYKETNPLYYGLIKRFYEKSGVPIILNTSFNLKGESIVNSPKDALVTFSFSEMDYLIMPPFVIKSYWGQR
jgi:carbamoyltransferase